MIARAARRAHANADPGRPAVQRASAAAGAASRSDARQLPWNDAATDDARRSAQVQESPKVADGSGSSLQTTGPWMPVPVHLHDAGTTAGSAEWPQRAAMYAAPSMWVRARRWLANA